MKKEKKILKQLGLLNPKNLEKEVHVYGYHFSWKSHVLVMLCALAGIGAVGIVFRLRPGFFLVILMAVVVLLPILIVDMYKKMFEQKRFADAVTYMEQMLYSFQKSGKIAASLKECIEIFEDGYMREAISKAIGHLEQGKSNEEKGILREALELIEKPYECSKIHMVHELLISAEEYGGEMEYSIMLLLEDLELWKRRGYRLLADKKKSHIDNIISVIVAVVLCAAALYILDSMKKLFPSGGSFDIFQVGMIQITSMIFILFLLYVFTKSSRGLTADWLNGERLNSPEYITQCYQAVINFDNGAEKRKSILFTIPLVVIAAAVFALGKPGIGMILLTLAALMLMQHRMGYHLAKGDVTNEMYLAIPQWLMEMALLLQNNNVQVSLAKSAAGAPAVLKGELAELLKRLEQEPGKLKSYTSFCKSFDIPEIHSCMKMLHAISESGTGNAKIQINNLVQRVNEMQRMADEIRNESISFRMKLFFGYPVIGATVKLLVDLTVGMMFMFKMLGGMGGM